MTRTLLTSVGVLLAIGVGAAACSSDDEGSGSESPIADMLGQLPEPDEREDVAVILYSDLDRATEVAGTERPEPGELDADSMIEWIAPLTGIRDLDESNVSIFMPSINAFVDEVDEFDDELGWSIRDVHSFIEAGELPNLFTVIDADVASDDLEDAIGDPSDGIWSLGGEDGDVDLNDITAARPLGNSLRLGIDDDDLLGVSRITPPVEAWLEGEGETLADDEHLLAVAEALDASDVFTAALTGGDEAGPDDPVVVLDEFEGFGAGMATDGDQPLLVLAYSHDDEDDAEANAEAIEELLEDGTASFGDSYDDLFDVRDIEVDGTMLVVTLELEDDVSARVLQQIVYQYDPLTLWS